MRYASLGGGKRVRPLLTFAAGAVSGASPERLEIAAAAIEMMHAYSLVHDDLPCMDDDVLRRGKPTAHVEYDEATALLAGDALQALAFQLLAEHRLADDPADQLGMVRALAYAAGSRGMAGGQAIDLESTGKPVTSPELELMHIHKTGALIRASVLLAAQSVPGLAAEKLSALDHYAKCIGLAFQIQDDILDVTGKTEALGKQAGADASRNKPTYPSLLGLEESRRRALDLHQQALAALAPFGGSAEPLSWLSEYIVNRET